MSRKIIMLGCVECRGIGWIGPAIERGCGISTEAKICPHCKGNFKEVKDE